jgi:hypothetical protein
VQTKEVNLSYFGASITLFNTYRYKHYSDKFCLSIDSDDMSRNESKEVQIYFTIRVKLEMLQMRLGA